MPPNIANRLANSVLLDHCRLLLHEGAGLSWSTLFAQTGPGSSVGKVSALGEGGQGFDPAHDIPKSLKMVQVAPHSRIMG